MRILVAGASGMLATEIVDAAGRRGHDVVALTVSELDIRDRLVVGEAVEGVRPDAVVNAAAFTDVDGAESDLETAMAVNAAGARNLAEAATAVGVTVVYPSSDFVFDGRKRDPYVESDATNPLSAYGRSKLEGELATAAASERPLIVRTSWLFGLAGRNFVEAMLGRARDDDSLRVVDDQVGCPTYARDLAEAIVGMLEADTNGTVHVAGGGHCSWYEFAVEIFRQAGIEREVEPCSTSAYPRPARRPAWSVLGSERPDAPRLRDWQEGLAEYLARAKTRAVRESLS